MRTDARTHSASHRWVMTALLASTLGVAAPACSKKKPADTKKDPQASAMAGTRDGMPGPRRAMARPDGMRPADMRPGGMDAMKPADPRPTDMAADADAGVEPPEPMMRPLPEVKEAAAPGAGGPPSSTPQFAGNAARTWVVGTAKIPAPSKCTRNTDFAIRGNAGTLDGGKVWAPNLNGRLRGWKTNPTKADDGWSAVPPVLAGELVISGDMRGNVRAYAQNAPTVKWSFKAGKKIRYSAAVAGNRVFVGSDDGHLYALDLQTGKLLWKFKARGRIATLPAVAANTVYFGCRKGRLYALDAEKGTLRWEVQSRLRVGSAPVATKDTLYVMTRGSKILAVNPADGKRRWKHWAGYSEVPSMVVSGGKLVFVYGNKKEIRALDIRTGKIAWKYVYPKETFGALYSPLYASGGRIHLLEGQVSRKDHNLGISIRCQDFNDQRVWATALDLSTGKVVFRVDLSAMMKAAVAEDPNKRRLRRCGKAPATDGAGDADDDPSRGGADDDDDSREYQPAILSHFGISGRSLVIPLIDGHAICK